MLVLFALSWRLGPILAGVIVATAFTATLYKDQTRAVETDNANATNEMNNIANQAFESITTVRYEASPAKQSETDTASSLHVHIPMLCWAEPFEALQTAITRSKNSWKYRAAWLAWHGQG